MLKKQAEEAALKQKQTEDYVVQMINNSFEQIQDALNAKQEHLFQELFEAIQIVDGKKKPKAKVKK